MPPQATYPDNAHFRHTWKSEVESEAEWLKKKKKNLKKNLKSVFALRWDRKACALNQVLWKGPEEVKKEDYIKNRISKTLHIVNKDQSIHFQSHKTETTTKHNCQFILCWIQPLHGSVHIIIRQKNKTRAPATQWAWFN